MSDEFRLHGRPPRPGRSGGAGEDAPERPGESAWAIPASPPRSEPDALDLGTPEPPPPPRTGAPQPAAEADPMTALLMQSLGGDEEAGSALPTIDIMRLVLGCLRRWYWIAGIAIAVAGLFVVLALTGIDHTWTASTVLIKRDTSEELTVGEGKAFRPHTYNLQTLLDTIKLPSSLDEIMARTRVQAPRTSFAAAIDVRLGKDSDILALMGTWGDPATATRIANETAGVFLEKSIDIQREDAAESLLYYAAQLEESRERRRLADARMLAFQQEHQLSDFDAETKARLGALANLEGVLQTKRSEAGAIQSSLQRLEQMIADEPDMVIEQTIYRSPLKQRLTEYEWELQEARSRYTPDNPKVQKLQKKVEVLMRMIGDSNDQRVPENTYSPNGYRQDLQLQLQELERNLKISTASAEAIARTIDGMEKKLDYLNAHQKEFVRLQSQQDAAQRLERSLLQRVDEIRLQVDRAQSPFDVLEPATPPPDPNPSGRKLVAAGGIVLDLGLGLAVALLLELLEPFVRSRRDGQLLSGSAFCLECPDGSHCRSRSVTDDPELARKFRQLLNDLETSLEPGALKSVAVVAAEPGAGHGAVAINLALTLAIKEADTLLVDADTRSPGELRPTGIWPEGDPARASGLYDVLGGTAELSAAARKTARTHLWLLPAGEAADVAAADLALGSRRMSGLIAGLCGLRHRVIYSLPPLDRHETALEATAEVGSAILVMRSGHSRRSAIGELVATLEQRRVKLVAAVVLDVPARHLENRPAGLGSRKPGAGLINPRGNHSDAAHTSTEKA